MSDHFQIIKSSFTVLLSCATLCFMRSVAVRQRSYDMALCLIMGGAFVEQVCLTKWTAMHEAAKVSSRARVPATSQKQYAANVQIFSQKEGCPAVLMLLLRHGAKVMSRDGHGVTPLGIAAEYGKTEALDILIQHGKTQSPRLDIILMFTWLMICCGVPPSAPRQAVTCTPRPATETRSCTTQPDLGTWTAWSCCFSTAPAQTWPATLTSCPSTGRRTRGTYCEPPVIVTKLRLHVAKCTYIL